jgi:hypothetical protein
VSVEARARILACSDDALLNQWLSKVATVHCAEDLLGGSPGPTPGDPTAY